MKEIALGIRRLEKPVPISPGAAAGLVPELREAHVELLSNIHVSEKLEAVEVEMGAMGTMMSVSAESRTIFARAILANERRSIILAHNHPFQRKAEPSSGDREFISQIKMGGQMIGVPILDAIIIGMEENFSFMERGVLFTKRQGYQVPKWKEPEGFFVTSGVDPGTAKTVSTPKKAADFFSFLKNWDKETTAVVHLTPDLEWTHAECYPAGIDSDLETYHIFRRAILSTSTKFLLFGTNSEKPAVDLVDRINSWRLAGTTLCIPVLDLLVLGQKDSYSFAEHGKIFPRSKSYGVTGGEGVRLKGIVKTRRADLPSHGWTIQ